MSFAETPEAQEYLQKIQQGRMELPEAANDLEREAFRNMQELGAKVRQVTTTIGDTEKRIEELKGRLVQMNQDRDMLSGELTGYAKMLVAAEGWRRSSPPTEPPKPAAELDRSAPASKPATNFDD